MTFQTNIHTCTYWIQSTSCALLGSAPVLNSQARDYGIMIYDYEHARSTWVQPELHMGN